MASTKKSKGATDSIRAAVDGVKSGMARSNINAYRAGLASATCQYASASWNTLARGSGDGSIAAACRATLQDQSCSLSQDQLDTIERQVRSHLQVTRKDDSVVGYWVLDDFPGDVRPGIELMHRLVQEDTLSGRVARPTVCGFGGDLDNGSQSTASSRAAFTTALTNFTPTGCDAVALYPYSRLAGSNPSWSMSELLPYMLDQLRARGWDLSQQPLIGVPQTFGLPEGVMPSEATVAAQTAAYCAGGATAILFYAWNDSFSGPKAELFNAPALRSGATTGLATPARASGQPRPRQVQSARCT